VASEREREAVEWAAGVIRRLALAACALVVTVSGAIGASGWRYVDLDRPGSTWDPATLEVVGDGTRRVSLSIPERIGGIYLTAVGTNTSLSGGEQPMSNARGHMAVLRDVPDCTLEDPVPLDCTGNEPSTECNFSEFGKSPEVRPRRNGVWRRVNWTAYGCVYLQDDSPSKTFPLARGVTTYTVRGFTRTVTPAVYRTIWDYQNSGDDFFNTCLSLNNVGSIKQRGGSRYCTVVVRPRKSVIRFRLTQATVITERFPARTCEWTACR
jgi:hypothetical protein